jgi:hypothetical protein
MHSLNNSDIFPIQLDIPLIQQPKIISFVNYPGIDEASSVVSSETLYKLLLLSNLIIQQENTIISERLQKSQISCKRIVSVTENDNNYRTEYQQVSDFIWPEEAFEEVKLDQSSLSETEKKFIKNLTIWIRNGISDLYPQFTKCLSTEVKLLFELKTTAQFPQSHSNLVNTGSRVFSQIPSLPEESVFFSQLEYVTYCDCTCKLENGEIVEGRRKPNPNKGPNGYDCVPC